MITAAQIHSIMQIPLIIVIAAVGAVMIQRSTMAASGIITVPSPAILGGLGAMMLLLAGKQLFWHAFWILGANHHDLAATSILSSAWIATILNAACVVFGGAVLSISTKHILGDSAPLIVVLTILGVTVLGAVATVMR